jgi:BioD-like phosphotransacetylase family protein
MVPIYIGSTMGYSGKSLVALGLGLKMKEDGLEVGYIKPLGRVPVMVKGELTDGDASFMKKTLSLPDPLDAVCPVVYSQDLINSALKGRAKDLRGKVMKAFAKISKGRDAVIIGGARDLYDGALFGISGSKMIEETDAKVIMVDPFSGEVCVDCLLAAKEAMGERLIGAVINKAPADGMEYIRGLLGPFLKRRGIPLLGVLPSDKLLSSITVRQLHESIGGRVVCRHDRMDEFVDNFSIGAMDVESALKYFRRAANKAVITGGHRTDIQLAALETSTKCLVLTGDLLPNELIITKAKLAGVPIISVKDDTLSAVERIEAVLGKSRIREERKVARALELIKEHFDFATFYARTGLSRP